MSRLKVERIDAQKAGEREADKQLCALGKQKSALNGKLNKNEEMIAIINERVNSQEEIVAKYKEKIGGLHIVGKAMAQEREIICQSLALLNQEKEQEDNRSLELSYELENTKHYMDNQQRLFYSLKRKNEENTVLH